MAHLAAAQRGGRVAVLLGQLGQRVGEALERGDELLGGPPALFLCAGGPRGVVLADLGDERRVLDQPLVALRLEEGVGHGGVRAVDFAREEGVGEPLEGFGADGAPFGGGGWGLERCEFGYELLKGGARRLTMLNVCDVSRRTLGALRRIQGEGWKI